MFRTLYLTILVPLAVASGVWAQPTNVEVLGRLAVRCLGEEPGEVDTFRLVPGERMPYLRPFLTRHWIERGYTVFVGDSSSLAIDSLHELLYDPQTASITYARARRDSLVRRVDLTMSHALVSPQGILLNEARCSDSASDMIREADVVRMQQDPWEETRGQLPLDRGWRTWAEPAVIGSSIAVVVYLFFSVRS